MHAPIDQDSPTGVGKDQATGNHTGVTGPIQIGSHTDTDRSSGEKSVIEPVGARATMERPALSNNSREPFECCIAESSVVKGFPVARATDPFLLESKEQLVAFLRRAGLSKQAARLVAAGGWPALSRNEAFDDLNTVMHRLETIIENIKRSKENAI